MLALTAAAVAGSLAAGMIWNRAQTRELIALLPVAFSSAGTFLPVWGLSDSSRFGPYQLGLLVWGLDTLKALVVIYSFDSLYRLGAAGRFLRHQRARASRLVAKRPRLRRASLGGLALFVLAPIPGTGAIAGTLLGVLLGMHRRAIVAAVSGASLSSAVIVATLALHSSHLLGWLVHAHTDPLYRFPIMGAVLLAGGGALLWWRHRGAR